MFGGLKMLESKVYGQTLGGREREREREWEKLVGGTRPTISTQAYSDK
jgi:hypothetical protein